MNVQPEKIDVYDWSDIQSELCKIMNIPEDAFRDYHKIVGGGYKDYWRVCLETIIPDNMTNGTIVTLYSWDDDGEPFEGDETWKNQLHDAWNTFYNSTDAANNDSGIEVRFSW